MELPPKIGQRTRAAHCGAYPLPAGLEVGCPLTIVAVLHSMVKCSDGEGREWLLSNRCIEHKMLYELCSGEWVSASHPDAIECRKRAAEDLRRRAISEPGLRYIADALIRDIQ